jgi:hypothetical protein
MYCAAAEELGISTSLRREAATVVAANVISRSLRARAWVADRFVGSYRNDNRHLFI